MLLTGVTGIHGKGSAGWLEGTEDPCAQQPWLLAQGGVITNSDASVNVSIIACGAQRGEPGLFPQSPVGAEVTIRLL